MLCQKMLIYKDYPEKRFFQNTSHFAFKTQLAYLIFFSMKNTPKKLLY